MRHVCGWWVLVHVCITVPQSVCVEFRIVHHVCGWWVLVSVCITVPQSVCVEFRIVHRVCGWWVLVHVCITVPHICLCGVQNCAPCVWLVGVGRCVYHCTTHLFVWSSELCIMCVAGGCWSVCVTVPHLWCVEFRIVHHVCGWWVLVSVYHCTTRVWSSELCIMCVAGGCWSVCVSLYHTCVWSSELCIMCVAGGCWSVCVSLYQTCGVWSSELCIMCVTGVGQYAKYLEQQNSIEGVRNVYRRACDIHLPKKPYIHLAWAAFEERQGEASCVCWLSCVE